MLIKEERNTLPDGSTEIIKYFGESKDKIGSTVKITTLPQETQEPPEEIISTEEIQAQILLNQAEIIANQQAQDEVLAEILISGLGV